MPGCTVRARGPQRNDDRVSSLPTTPALSFYTGKTVLVTGASGFLATNLIHALAPAPCRILRLSRATALPRVRANADIQDVRGDLRRPDTWRRALNGVDAVFHFAGQTSVYVAESDPQADLDANVLPMLNLLEACRATATAPAIVFAGSATEVGITESVPVGEAPEDRPVTVYDAHKLMAETYLKMHARLGLVRGTTLRLTNVYGPGPRNSGTDRGIIDMMMDRALAGETITVYGKGDCLRDYIHVDDAVSAFLAAAANMERLNGRHFVIGSGEGHTIAEAFNLVADQVARRTNSRVPVDHVTAPAGQSPIEKRSFVADTSAFRAATGWRANLRLADGINQTVAAMTLSKAS